MDEISSCFEIVKLMALTDPSLLGLVFDCGHYRFGGGDPIEGLRKYGKRVRHFHFKDYHPGVGKQVAQNGWDYFKLSERVFSVNWAKEKLTSHLS